MEYVPIEIVKEIYEILSSATDENWSVAKEARDKALSLIENNRIKIDANPKTLPMAKAK